MSDDKKAIIRAILLDKGDMMPEWTNAIMLSDILHIPPWEVAGAIAEHPEWVEKAVCMHDAKHEAIEIANKRQRR